MTAEPVHPILSPKLQEVAAKRRKNAARGASRGVTSNQRSKPRRGER